jgi:hypothetical protein
MGMSQTYKVIVLVAIIYCPLFLYPQTTRVSEPIFGIQYDPAIVHFEKAPPLIGEACRDMRGKKVIVYAHLTYHDIQFFVVQEYLGEFGVAIAISNGHCAEIDSDRFLYDGPDALAEQGIDVEKDQEKQLMHSVAANILIQYSKAFGGKQKFLRALGTRADGLPQSTLRTELEQYENEN